MVIAKMKGGLGNQFFIYAAARAFSLQQGSPLFLEVVSGFKRDPYKRTFLLDQYPVQAKQVRGKYAVYFVAHSSIPRTVRSFIRFFTGKRAVFINDSSSRELNALKPLPQSTFFLDGYWQNESFFRPFADQIKKELTWKETERMKKSATGKAIRSTCSVAIHGRLMRNFASDGTQVSQNDSKNLPAAYYQRAIERIAEEVPRPHFFLFSDNLQVFEEQLNFMGFPYTPVHQHRQNFPGADLALMSNCHHFIISNSTYSWWGAYLSENLDKRIIAPPKQYWDNPQILPSEWMTLNL